jgi:acyl carrier protein
MSRDAVGERVRELIRELAGSPDAADSTADVRLFRGGLELDSVTAAALLTRIRDELGVDVPAEDLNLDCLETVATLTAFVRARAPDEG